MAVSVEAYTLVNLCMNVIVIGIIARSENALRLCSVLTASVIGTVYALAMQTRVFHLLRVMPLQILLAFALAAIAFRVEKPMDLLRGGIKLLLATMFLASAQQIVLRLLGTRSLISFGLGAAFGGIALAVILNARARKLERWEVELVLRTRYGQIRLTALIDTGNRLHEPLSGLPVLIVEEKRLKRLLPPGFDGAQAAISPPPGYRLVGYGALNGTGRMACFKPEELLASYGDGWMRAPDVWVAIFPGRMAGDVCALAPTVIGRIQPANRRSPMNQKVRMERGMRR